jgi:hypothetical protein
VSRTEVRYADESELLAAARVEAQRAFAARTSPGRGVMWWASVIALVGVGTIAAAFVYSYYYLRLGAESWPLAGTEVRDWQLPVAALVAVVAALVLGPTARRGRAMIAVAGASAAAGAGLQAVGLARSDHAVDANAYEALVVTIDVLAAVLLVSAIAVRVAAVGFGWPRRGPNALHDADAAWFVGCAVLWIALWAVLHLSPRVI